MEANARQYVFDEFTLDPSRARLLCGDEPVALRPKAFDALCVLVERRGRLVTKDELMGALWPKVVVTDDSLVKCIQEVRAALGDRARDYVKTVPRRGYLFDGPVTERPTPGSTSRSAAPPGSAAGAAGTLRARVGIWTAAAAVAAGVAGLLGYYAAHRGVPADGGASTVAQRAPKTVAVLPFVSISADPDQDYFSDGISEELLNVLANVPGLQVPSRTSSFAFKAACRVVARGAAVRLGPGRCGGRIAAPRIAAGRACSAAPTAAARGSGYDDREEDAQAPHGASLPHIPA